MGSWRWLATGLGQASRDHVVMRILRVDKRILTIHMRAPLARILFSLLVMAAIAPGLYRAYGIFGADRRVQGAKAISNYSRAIEYDPGNGALWWMRGRLRHYELAALDIPGAIRDYEQALLLNPRLGQAWVDLADCYERIGSIPRTEASLQKALQVWTYSPLIRWQAGNLYLLRGDLKKMYECFKMASEYDIDKLRMAMQIAWKVDPDHAMIDRKLVPDKLPARLLYFDFLVAHDELDLARQTWERSLRNPTPPGYQYKVSIAFPYIERLTAKYRIEDALRVWQEVLRKSGMETTDGRFVGEGSVSRVAKPGTNLIWNGSFENEILRGGFDWRYSDLAAVQLQTAMDDRIDGLKSLRLTFGGTNIDAWYLSQIVPILAPGDYLLECYVKTVKLTTDKRPYLQIEGFPDAQGATLKTGPFPESSAWHKYSFPFTVRAGTRAVQLVLRRDPSDKLDSQLKGSLWLDNFSIRAQNQPRMATVSRAKEDSSK